MDQSNMALENAAAAGLAAKYGIFAKLAALLGGGVLGALVIAAVDPAEAIADPKKRRHLIFAQVMVAATVAGVFGKFVTSWLGRPNGWFPVDPGDAGAWIELGMPVGLTLGALSWGLIGALVKLRQIISDRGADAIARRTGLEDQAKP